MESSSIMSFNNESTLQTTVKGESNNMSVHELALHAMRDRCLLLQRRINALENDNMKLKLDITKVSAGTKYPQPLQDDEKSQFQKKIAELTKQKSQLLHHVFMVSCENKNLWGKISTLKGSVKIDKEHLKQPLVRTNTYIHSTPKSTNNQERYNESSLEEISLKLINSYIQEKSQLVEQYEQMTQMQDDEILNLDSIGFNYIGDPHTDSFEDIQTQAENEKLNLLKQELAQQEKDLKVILSKVEFIVQNGYKCPSCASNSTKITTSEHKEIETSDSLANWATPVESSNYNNLSDLHSSVYKKTSEDHHNEPYDKVCPMCGQTFPKDILFAEFQSHVESHFTGEVEPDSVLDNTDNISNSFDHLI